ncbi:MAG: DUF1080 domain-containing protein [Bacteroidota bacterium]
MKKRLLLAAWIVCSGLVWAGEPLPLQDLSAFQKAGANWQIVQDVRANLDKEKYFETEAGTGVLVNLPDKDNQANLFFSLEHGDADIDLEFMMARASNSGIYLQGRYEVQLLDSWGKKYPTYQDCGAIYQRWDDSKPEGEKGYQGHPPRINACRAPGIWQKLHISFQAPRFDALGNKTANARILKVVLNGMVLHENVELTGPTRGPAFEKEAATGPLMIQGDHGPVAFRNVQIQAFGLSDASTGMWSYQVYEGFENPLPDFTKRKAIQSGKTEQLTQEVVGMDEGFLIKASSMLTVSKDGPYLLDLQVMGTAQLVVNGKVEIPFSDWSHQKTVELTQGSHAVEIVYGKPGNWYPNSLGLFVSGPGMRPKGMHAFSSIARTRPQNPISVNLGSQTQVMRSFVDYPSAAKRERRIVHAVSTGFPERISYTYDTDRAALALVWKGGFLDATPMWDSRGDGSSRPKGSAVALDDEAAFCMLPTMSTTWPESFQTDLNYRFEGYMRDENGVPSFTYELGGTQWIDRIMVSENGLKRMLSPAQKPLPNLYLKMASGKEITAMKNERYLIDGRYYIQIGGKQKAQIREQNGQKELLLPLDDKIQGSVFYSIIW